MLADEVDPGRIRLSWQGTVDGNSASASLVGNNTPVLLERFHDGFNRCAGIERVNIDARIELELRTLTEYAATDAPIRVEDWRLFPQQRTVHRLIHNYAQGVIETGRAIQLSRQHVTGKPSNLCRGCTWPAVTRVKRTLYDLSHVRIGISAAVQGELPEIVERTVAGINNHQMSIIRAPATHRRLIAFRRIGHSDEIITAVNAGVVKRRRSMRPIGVLNWIVEATIMRVDGDWERRNG